MKRVLFLVNHDVVIYNFRLELVEKLIEQGHKVIISSPYGERIEVLKKLGCEYHEIELSRHGTNPSNEIHLINLYKKLLKKVKPNIVFSYTIKPNIYGAIACKSLKIPIVTNITGLGTAVENKGITQKISVLLYKYAFTNVQKIFFQNQENMDFFKKHKINTGKYDMLPGSGVNLQRFASIDYPKTDKVIFSFISRIMKEKGVDQYLEAAEYIKEKYPNTCFNVCGFCEQFYDSKLQDLAERGIIVYHGMVRDVREILKDTNCTIHPTYYPEGMSNVLLESCASARPIITTDRSGCREIIDDGVNGFIVKQQDAHDLIKNIEAFLSLSYEEQKIMGLAGRKKVEKEFDRQIVVSKYLQELENGL